MFYFPSSFRKLAVIYVREGENVPPVMTADTQETSCRDYCKTHRIPVSHSVRVSCGVEESLDVLKMLLRTLPKEVDTIIAMRFFCYSVQLQDLNRLCLAFRCRQTQLYSLELMGPIHSSFRYLLEYDDENAERYYSEMLQE